MVPIEDCSAATFSFSTVALCKWTPGNKIKVLSRQEEVTGSLQRTAKVMPPQIVSHNLPTLPTPRPLPLAALLLVGFGILWMASRVASQSGHATASVAKMDGTPSVKHSLYEEEQSPCGTTQAPATQAPANPCSTTLAPASPCATTPKPGATGPGGAGPGGAGPGAPGPAGPGGPPGASGGGKTRSATPEEDLTPKPG